MTTLTLSANTVTESLVCPAHKMKLPTSEHALAHAITHGRGHAAVIALLDDGNTGIGVADLKYRGQTIHFAGGFQLPYTWLGTVPFETLAGAKQAIDEWLKPSP